MADEYTLTLNDYLAILRRRAFHLAGVFSLIALTTIIVAVVVPPVYQSTGTVLVESQQISASLVQGASTTSVEEHIAQIKQRVMTRENLLRIIDKYHLYKDDRRNLASTELVDEMRESILVEPLSAGTTTTRARGAKTIAFKLSFEYRHADAAYRVANELVTLFLNENVKSRTERASEATAFMSQEAERLKADLEKIEGQVAAYKQGHPNALPENQGLRMSMLERNGATLKDLERDYRTTQEELRYLDIELTAAKAGSGARQAEAPATPASELERLKSEYVKLSGTYTENHPTLRTLKRKIETLEKSEPPATSTNAEKPAPTATMSTTTDLLVAKIQLKIDAANARLTSLTQQQNATRAKISQLEREIMQAPNVELGLTTLLRDYENAKKKYEEVQAKQMTAQISENLEQDNKAERFSLIEPPQQADKPVKPDRMKILLIGFMLAFAGSGGFVFLLETLHQRIWGVDAVTSIMRLHPLVVIPYITIHEETVRKKRRVIMAALAIILLLVISAILVHMFYMPLNVLLFKIAARFG